jgi:uncharacterized protein (TIGR02996 family)
VIAEGGAAAVTHDEAFLQTIREAPGDATPKLVYADWLGEHERPDEEHLWRWLAKRGLWPAPRSRYPATANRSSHKVREECRWAWYPEVGAHDVCFDRYRSGKPIPRVAVLPQAVFMELPGRTLQHAFYASEESALLALRVALMTLRKLLEV